MKFNKINIDRAPLTADEINAAMDFNGLINPKASVASTSGGGKIIKLGMYTLAAAAITAGVWFYMTKAENTQLAETAKTESYEALQSVDDLNKSSVLTPPLEGYEKEFLSGTISAESGGELTLGSSTIKVPPYSFVNAEGELINGMVQLNYREFNDVLDIFLSGIPMEYDSAGVAYTFESNGMFELRGFQENEAVYVAQGKALEVKMAIDDVKPSFSEYVLDESTGKWVFKNGQNYEVEESEGLLTNNNLDDEELFDGESEVFPEAEPNVAYDEFNKLKIKELVDNEPRVKAIEEKIKKIVKEKEAKKEPKEPVEANPELPQIQIEVDLEDFPELKAFKNTLFQVAESDLDDFNMEWGQETWTDMKINKSTKPGFYKLVFSKPGRRETVNASPVLSEADMADAEAKYEQLFSQYETAIDSLDTAKKLKEKELKAAKAQARKEARERAAAQAELQKLRQQQMAQQQEDLRKNRIRTLAEQDSIQKAFRDQQLVMASDRQKAVIKQNFLRQDVNAVFQVNGFGFYNCDKPSYYPQGAAVLAEYTNQNDENVVQNVMLVEKGRRALWNYYNQGKLKFNPKENNILLGVTSNNKIALLAPNQFNDIDHRKKSCVIKMKECEEELTSKEEIQDFIKAQGFDI